MKLRRKIAILLALLLLASLPLITTVIADAADFSGSSDYGGSSGSSDDDSGLLSLCLNIGVHAACEISDAAVESGVCTRGQTVIAFIIIGAILLACYLFLRKIKSRSGQAADQTLRNIQTRGLQNVPEGTAAGTNGDALPIARYTALDPNFSAEDLKEELQNLFYRMLTCREQRDVEPIEPYFTERAFRSLSAEMKALTERGEHEHFDRTAALNIRINSYRRGSQDDTVFAEIYARSVCYRTNDESGKVVSGSDTNELFVQYSFSLTRSIRVKTAPRGNGVSKRNCPNCGAPISENETVKCPFCGSVLPLREDAWRVDEVRRTVNYGPARTVETDLKPIDSYSEQDENFSPEQFRLQLRDLYTKLQSCCTKRDYEPIRTYFADSFYQQLNRQAERLTRARQTNYVDGITVLSVELRGWYRDKGEDVIVAQIVARIVDYTLNDVTGALVSGSKKKAKLMTYEYALSRPVGKKTGEKSENDGARYCPNCGAALNVNEAVKCPYCGTVITFADHDWTVYSIKGISQQTL